MKSRNQRLFALLLILAETAVGPLLPADVGAAETTPISLSGAIYHGNEPDLGLTDLWLATLSKQPTLKVLERADIRTILGELSLAGVSDDSARQVRLGRLLGVEYFAWIKASDDQALMEIVEAATGRGISVVPVRFAKGHFADILPKLAEQAVQAVTRPLPAPSQVAPSIAFSIPRFSVSNETVQAAVETVMADVSGAWANSGITMLSRRFAADAVQERWRQEKGLAEDVSQGQAFLGADYILGIAVDATNRIELIMIETATGRRVGRKEMPLEEARTADGLKALKQWGLDRLKPLLERSSILPPAAVINGHYAAPEILKSLYAGMVLHNQGRYIDALPLIEDSKSRKIHIDETEAWIVNCYRLAGFPEIADTVLLDKQPGQVNKQTIPTLSAQSEPGLALLGVTAGAGISRGLSERLGMLLIDRLHEASGMTVLASEDIAGMRDEYDLLLGLDKVKGTTWRQAPPILLRDAVTGHLEPDKAGIRLRLCLIRNCNPTSIYDAVTSLPADHEQWQLPIDKAVSELLARRDRGSPVWSPPDVTVEEDQRQLLTQLETSFGSWIYLGYYYKHVLEASPTSWIYLYLKALTRNSDLTKYREQVPWRMGLYKWFLRVLPEGHPDRPVLEFSVASLPIAGYRQWAPDALHALQKSRVEFQRIAEKYPVHFVGQFSRYNLAIIDMTPANYLTTQEQISRLLPKLIPFQNFNSVTTQEQINHLRPELIPYQSSECANSIARIRRMNSALCYALGLPDGNPDDVMNCSSLITINSGNTVALFAEGFMAQYLIPRDKFHKTDSYFMPKTPEQMRVDLDALCFMRDQGTIPACFLRGIIEKNGPDSELTRYAVLKYYKAMTFTPNRQGWPEADLCAVCPVFADCLKKLLERNPQPMSESGVNKLMGFTLRKSDNPVLSDAAKKARQVLETAFPSASDERRRKSFDESWKVGPLKDPAWINYCSARSPPVMEDYYPYLQRLHELYDNEVKSHAICRVYCQFGLAFFQMERYDLAEPLFEQIVSWRDYKNHPPEKQVYALSLYLLARLKQRNGAAPSALRLAKDALDFMDAHPQNQFHFQTSCSLQGVGVLSRTRELKPMIIAFVQKLRENPKTSFNNPFTDKP